MPLILPPLSPAPDSVCVHMAWRVRPDVARRHGVVYFFVTYPTQTTPVTAIIEKHLQLPVAIDNSANVMARAEHRTQRMTVFGRYCRVGRIF